MVPRFGEDYARVIGEGVGNPVLNSTSLGIGHYTGTQMPGEVGNFAVEPRQGGHPDFVAGPS